MSIYIPGMKMPKICGECPFVMDDDDFAPSQCGRTDYTIRDGIIDPFGKPDWCDLIELHPHGRLIDADEFLDRAIGTQCFRGDYALMLEELVGESTTIIPASEEVQ